MSNKEIHELVPDTNPSAANGIIGLWLICYHPVVFGFLKWCYTHPITVLLIIAYPVYFFARLYIINKKIIKAHKERNKDEYEKNIKLFYKILNHR